jgi:antibiotic biosynthesis monooxygenase (ABM) superfamily enzyme
MPAQKHPEPYKQFLVTLSAIFPMTIVVPWALRPLFQVAPVATVLNLPGISNLTVSAIIVGLMTYVIMPRFTRLVEGGSIAELPSSSRPTQTARHVCATFGGEAGL